MSDKEEMITDINVSIVHKYNFTAGASTTRFLFQLKKGVLTGQRCPSCSNVYCPPKGACASCGVATEDEVALSNKATIESFTIVAIPIPNNPIKPPFIVANLIPDGANISLTHLLSECVNEEVYKGQRVQAVWKPEQEWGHDMGNIRYYKPLDEPDVPLDMIGKLPVEGLGG